MNTATHNQDVALPTHQAYRDGLRLWTSKWLAVPAYWGEDRKRREVIRRGTERILRGVVARYGDERELRYMDILALGKVRDHSIFVLVAYVPCDDGERPGHDEPSELILQ